MSSVAIVGPGRLGLSLADAFAQSRAVHEVVVFGRHPEAPEHPVLGRDDVRYVYGLAPLARDCQAVFLTVPDDAVPEVAYSLAGQGDSPAGCAAFHVSGVLPTDVLEPLHHRGFGVGSFYPLVVAADPVRGASRMAGAWAAVTAAPETFRTAQRLGDAIGVDVFGLPALRRPLFHAAVTLVGGALAPILMHAAHLLEQTGVDEAEAFPAVVALARSALDAFQERDGPSALTGPVLGGDVDQAALHLRALDPADRRTYSVLARELLRLGEQVGEAPEPAGRAALEELFERYAAGETTSAGVGG